MYFVLASSSFEQNVTTGLTESIGPYAEKNKMGFWFGFRNSTASFSVALGVSDGASKKSMKGDIIPAGSLAKPFTAVGVLGLVELGLLELDDRIPQHIDPFLMRENGTTLEALYGEEINNVTVRMLLQMRSGLKEYNDAVIKKYTVDYPQWDISPYDYLAIIDNTFVFPPGT